MGDPRFSKEVEDGDQDAAGRDRSHPRAAQTIEGDAAMTDSGDDFELVRGGGNVFKDMGHPNPEALQLKTILAAKIIGVLDDQKLTVRKAEEITGVAASDFSRIRNAKLSRFTIDRMMMILGKLDQDVEVIVTTRPHKPDDLHPA
jgi:predicted XRE-type DNA-binding protein